MGAAAAAAEKYKQAFEEESQVKAPKQWKIVSKDVYDQTPSWKRRKEDKTIYRRDGAYNRQQYTRQRRICHAPIDF